MRQGVRRQMLRSERGQTLVLMALLLPTLLGIAAIAVDGSRLFVQRRTLQNAADAAALAVAKDCDALTGCTSSALSTVTFYSGGNGYSGPAVHLCAGAGDTNCYQPSYKGDPHRVQVRLQQSLSDPFGKLANYLGVTNLKASASAVASADDGSQPLAFYAMSTQNSNGFKITGDNNTFPAAWSNACFDPASAGTNNSTPYVFYGQTGCTSGNNFFTNNPNFGYLTRAQVAVRCATCWPRALPNVAQTGSGLCNPANGAIVSTSLNIRNNWTRTNAQGIYCTTGSSGISIASSLSKNDGTSPGATCTAALHCDLTGYTFIATGSGTVTSQGTFVDFSPATAAIDSTTGVGVTIYAGSGATAISIGSVATWTGDLYAPNGPIQFNASTAGLSFHGYMEGDSVNLTASNVTFFGTGPKVGAPSISLVE
jgi:hypothetical protein